MSWIRGLNGLLGIVLIVAGLTLAHIPFIVIEQAPTSDSFRLLQFHFILTGVTSLLVARSRENARFVLLLAFYLAGINFWIGGCAIFAGQIEHLWTLIFSVVGSFNLGQLFTQPDDGAGEESASLNNGENDRVDEGLDDNEDFYPLIRPDIWKIESPGAGGLIKSIFGVALYISAVILIITLIFLYGKLLQMVIFDDAVISFARIGKSLITAFSEQWPIIAAYVVVLGSVYIIQAIFTTFSAKSDLGQSDDVNRALNDQERRYLADGLQAILDYLKNKSFGVFPRIALVAFVALPITTMLAAPFLLYFFEEYMFTHAVAARLEGLNVLVQNGPAFFGGLAAAFFFGVAIGWATIQWIGGSHILLAQYLQAKAGWNSMSSSDRTAGDHLKILTRFVRLRRLDVKEEFLPGDFLYQAFRERAGLVYRTTMFLGLMTIIFTTADIRWFQIVHTEGIHYSRYLEPWETQVELGDVDRVELRCFRFDADDDEVAKLGVGYRLKKTGKFSVEVLWHEERTPEFLDRLDTLDASLQEAGVPFVRAPRAGILWGGKSGYLDDCGAQVLSDIEPPVAARLIKLLRAN